MYKIKTGILRKENEKVKREILLLLELITLGLFGLVVATILFHIIRYRVPGDFSIKMLLIFGVLGGVIIFLSLGSLEII